MIICILVLIVMEDISVLKRSFLLHVSQLAGYPVFSLEKYSSHRLRKIKASGLLFFMESPPCQKKYVSMNDESHSSKRTPQATHKVGTHTYTHTRENVLAHVRLCINEMINTYVRELLTGSLTGITEQAIYIYGYHKSCLANEKKYKLYIYLHAFDLYCLHALY
jgi:hypothetical protein